MEFVRVSEVLARLQDFGNIDQEVLENKKNIGIDVHKAIDAHANREFMPEDEPRRLAYFGSYALWHARTKPVYKMTERRFFDNSLMITGQVDAVVSFDGRLTLVDFKTSANESKGRDGKSIWEMQAHYYKYLLSQNGIQTENEMHFVKLNTKRVKDDYFGSDMVIAAEPKVFKYRFNTEVMDRCIDEVQKYWEERQGAISLD